MNERDKELAKQAGWPESIVSPIIMAKLKEFADLIRADATEAANRRANASWALMCKKMVSDEREACAKVCEEMAFVNPWPIHYAHALRARGNT